MAKYSKLKGKIVEVFGTQEAFAKALQTTPQTVTAKLRGKSIFSQPEIVKWSEILGITRDDIVFYFFTN